MSYFLCHYLHDSLGQLGSHLLCEEYLHTFDFPVEHVHATYLAPRYIDEVDID